MSDEIKPDGTYIKKAGPNGVGIIWYNGKPWNLPTLNPTEDILGAEQYLRSQRKNPFLEIKKHIVDLPDDMAREVLDRAYRDMIKGDVEKKIPRHEIAAWLDTHEGLYWSVHHAMLREYPDITLDTVKAMLQSASLAECLKMRDEMLEG